MDSFETILCSFIAFNLVLGFFAIFLVKKFRIKQDDKALIKRQQMLEQGKIITAQEKQLKSKQDLLKEKEELLKLYRKLNG